MPIPTVTMPVAPTWPDTAVVPAAAIEEQCEEDQHVLLWQVHGESEVVVDGADLVLPAGSALWIPVEVPHSLTIRPDSAVLPLFFVVGEPATVLSDAAIFPVHGALRVLLLVAV